MWYPGWQGGWYTEPLHWSAKYVLGGLLGFGTLLGIGTVIALILGYG